MYHHNNKLRPIILICCLIFCCGFFSLANAKPINIVAAENFYGEIAQQIGGTYVNVISILNNPNQDPHLFSASPSTAKAIANADIIIYNGASYDPWMDRLLSVSSNSKQIIKVSTLLNNNISDNPHLWYNPATMPLFAKTIATSLMQHDPQHSYFYAEQLKKFQKNYQTLLQKIAQLKQNYQGIAIIATEPIFNDMAQALGFNIRAQAFQLAIMNDSTPTASQISGFENDLKTHAVRVLIYNNQVSDPTTQRMQTIARQNSIPIVGMSETQPAGKTYVEWMLDQLNALEKALQK